MKNFSYLTAAALLVLGGCKSETNDEGFVDKAHTISFSAYSAKTRAYTSGDVANIDNMKEGSFGVVGYTADNNIYLGSASKAIEQHWNGTIWDYATASDLKYWPEGAMDFYAYFPYSASGDVFAASDASGDVMTITNNSGNQDVLFARQANVSQTTYVPLYFKHALSKIKSVIIQVNAVDVEVTVKGIKFLNTATKGQIKVTNDGNASYGTTSEPRSFDLSASPKVIDNGIAAGVALFDNDDNGYVFATNTNPQHNVYGTRKTMWTAGDKTSLGGGNLSASNFVVMELECKVEAAGHYLVGTADTFDKMYIPMHGNSANGADITELLAGRRYTYKVVMTSNVGYKDDGDPIMLAPIRFSVNEVPEWNDVEVTINL